MISVAAIELLLEGDMSPEALRSFVDDTKHPMSELREARRQLADRTTMPLVSPLRSGETRPLIGGHYGLDPRVPLDSVCAALLYSHSVAIPDPLEDALDRAHGMSPAGEKQLALESLNTLAILRPLIDTETVILIPFDLLPNVRLDFRRVEARLEGARAQIFAVLNGDSDGGELHVRPRVSGHLRELELVAQTGWAVQIKPISPKGRSPLGAYAVNALLREGRRRFRRKRIQNAFMGRFDSFAIDTLTRVPVPDLSDLDVGDIQLIRDEDAFGQWRRELTAVVAEYERNVDAVVLGAAGIARDRLTISAEAIQRVVDASSALAAIRAGLSTFAVAGSATLASFPILSAEGRRDGLGIAVGSSLIDTGRRMIMCERDPTKVSQYRHHRAAEAIFRSAFSAEDGGRDHLR